MREKMPYHDIERGWYKLMDDWKNGTEREKEIRRKIMEGIKRSGKTPQEYVRELCEKNKRKNEKRFRKLDKKNTPNIERAIILCEYIGTAFPLALAGYVYNPFNKKRKK
ncbi:MAG: hypothetical protein KAW45_06715 [Thermoplasmatales archaeon]|nr:hypothetical protein [Thermoplasmatales archaeon]